jgi:hypothetical protein
MSAFVVNKSHINAMLQGAFSVRYQPFSWYHDGKHHQLTNDNADEIGQMLLDECIKSVSYRYADDKVTDLPGPTNGSYLVPFQHHPMGKIPTPVELIKITHCYMYQSCEHDEWKENSAKAFCDALISSATNKLPGYDAAPWEWEEELPETKPVRLI